MPRSAETNETANAEERVYEFGPFRVDAVRRRLWRHDEPVPLSSRAFDTLLALVHRAGRVVEKDELMRLVWPDTFVVDDNLTQQISALRKALGDHPDAPRYILTVPRRGYRLLVDVTQPTNGHGHDASTTIAAPFPAPASATPPHRFRLMDRLPRWALVAATLAVALLVTARAIVGISRKPPGSLAAAVRFVETPPDGVTGASAGVIAPDGRTIVYVASDSSGQTMLMMIHGVL